MNEESTKRHERPADEQGHDQRTGQSHEQHDEILALIREEEKKLPSILGSIAEEEKK